MTSDIKSKVITAARGVPSTKRLLAFLSNEAPVDALARAQRSSDWMERADIARNPNTPLDVVKRLAEDGSVVVRTIAQQKVTQIGKP